MPDAVVHVVDDDAAMRDSLAFLLASAGLQTAVHESAAAFLEALPGLAVGCVITDVRMPEISGIDLLQRLRRDHPKLPVIVMTGHGDIALAVQAMKSGATDFIEKPFDDRVLLAAVESALGSATASASEDAERAAIAQRLAELSPRERQVLDGLVAGKPNKVIAFDLDISPRTVEVYRANVMTKMQADSLSQLVRMAISAGALPG